MRMFALHRLLFAGGCREEIAQRLGLGRDSLEVSAAGERGTRRAVAVGGRHAGLLVPRIDLARRCAKRSMVRVGGGVRLSN